MNSPMQKVITIREFYSGKNIFVTGATGYIGRVLVEKLLRSCPDLGKIYVLLRPKKGRNIEERVQDMTNVKLFDLIREKDPSVLQKIIPIEGDVRELNLGLSPKDRDFLIENINIVFHSAASVRFEDPLKYALIINTRGTREVSSLVLEMKNISVFVHVSTTYCNCDKLVVEERLYPPFTDWKQAIKLAEEMDPHVMDVVSEKFIHPMPNTYTFTKQLSEHVVNDMCVGKVKTIIVRPSVVIPSVNDPFAGWVDNMNGPIGLLTAGGKGLLRCNYGNNDTTTDFISVDTVSKTMIVASWIEAIKSDMNELTVYNASGHNKVSVPYRKLLEMGARLTWDVPFSEIMWYPRFKITKCWYEFYMKTLLYHMLPALILDMILKLCGRKPMLFKLQRKIYIANMALFYFVNSSWKFPNDRMCKLNHLLHPSDVEDFANLSEKDFTMEDFYRIFKNGKEGVMLHILNEKIDWEYGRKNTFRFWVLDIFLKTMLCGIGAWLFFFKFNVPLVVFKLFSEYWDNLE